MRRAARTSAALAGFPRLISRDLEEVREQGARVFCEHRLSVVGPRQSLNTRLYYRSFGGIGLGRLRYGATVEIDPGQLEHFYLMQWPQRGGETIRVAGQEIRSSARVGTLVCPAQRFSMRHLAGTEKLFVRIDRAALARLADRIDPARAGLPLEFQPALDFDRPALASLRRLLGWLFEEASGGTLLEQPLLVAQAEEMLLLALLRSVPHNRPERLQTQASVTPGFVRRAEAWMAEHAGEAITVSQVAQQVGVSLRSLYAGFQRYRGCSPMAHLRALRLARVRVELQRPDGSEGVTATALHWGFGHLGQFSIDYRARFGERPSETLRRARALG